MIRYFIHNFSHFLTRIKETKSEANYLRGHKEETSRSRDKILPRQAEPRQTVKNPRHKEPKDHHPRGPKAVSTEQNTRNEGIFPL